MNKLYILGLAGIMTLSVSAQKRTNNSYSDMYIAKAGYEKTFQRSLSSSEKNQKGLTAFYTNNFDNPAEWSISNMGTPSTDWVIGSASPTGSFSSSYGTIMSTSGGNFGLFDSDALGSTGAVQDALLALVAPINCSAKTNVHLSFESLFSQYQIGDPTVEVSNDGSTWTTFNGFHADVAGNTASDNPALITLNISAVADNQATVYVRFRYLGEWEYAWMVDDLQVGELSGLDASIMAIGQVPGNEQLFTPFSQLQSDYSLVSIVENLSADAVTNPSVSVDVNGGFFTGSESVATVLNTGDTASSSINFDESLLTAPGLLTIAYDLNVSISGTDDDLSNNKDTVEWFITDSTLGTVPGVTSFYPDADTVTSGYIFEITNADTLTSASAIMYFGSGTEGQQTVVYVQEITNDTANPFGSILAISNPYTIISSDTGQANIAEKLFTFPNDGVVLQPGTYMLVHEDAVVGKASVLFNTDYTENGTSLITFGDLVDGWFNFTNNGTWAMYVNFGSTIPVNPSCAGFSASVSTVNVTAQGAQDGSASVVVSGGTPPYTYAWSNNASSDMLSGLPVGSYTVTVTDANNCFAVANGMVDFLSGLGSIESLSELSIFPNPTKDWLTISAIFENRTNVQVQLLDMASRIVYSDSFASTNVQASFDVSSLAKGVYYVRLSTAEGAVIRKVSIQ